MTWNPPSDTELAHKKPILLDHSRRIRDMIYAMGQGLAGAQRIDPIAAMAHQGAVGAVGTWAFLTLVSASAQIVAGTAYAGSGLRYTGFATQTATPPFGADYNTNGATPSGTWLAMGTTPAATSMKNPATLFLRIS